MLDIIINPITFSAIAGIVIIILLLFFSALISGSEVAFFSFKPEQIKILNETETKKSQTVLKLLKKPEKLLATILITNNFINVGIVIISSYVINAVFDFSESQTVGFIIEIVIITFFLLLFGEIIPKIYATNASIPFAKSTSQVLYFLSKFFNPISKLLIKSTSIVDKHVASKSKNISVEDLSHAFKLTEQDINTEKKILKGIISFGSKDVKQIMRPRVDVIAACTEDSIGKLFSIIVESSYSRIPVYEESPDNIKGVLYIKDLLPHIDDKNFNWHSIIRKPYFVPENMKIDYLLNEFQSKKVHMAIITDEYGGFSGIATMEDVLEEIVGEISDELDTEETLFEKLADDSFIFDAKIQLNDFFKATNINSDLFETITGDADSLAGFILEKIGKIPEKGTIVKHNNFIFEIVSADNRKIKRIKFSIEKNNNFKKSFKTD